MSAQPNSNGCEPDDPSARSETMNYTDRGVRNVEFRSRWVG